MRFKTLLNRYIYILLRANIQHWRHNVDNLEINYCDKYIAIDVSPVTSSSGDDDHNYSNDDNDDGEYDSNSITNTNRALGDYITGLAVI